MTCIHVRERVSHRVSQSFSQSSQRNTAVCDSVSIPCVTLWEEFFRLRIAEILFSSTCCVITCFFLKFLIRPSAWQRPQLWFTILRIHKNCQRTRLFTSSSYSSPHLHPTPQSLHSFSRRIEKVDYIPRSGNFHCALSPSLVMLFEVLQYEN